jgi:hypothetical protein
MADIVDAIITEWKKDTTLCGDGAEVPGLLGGTNVFRYDLPEPPMYPCVRVRLEGTVGGLEIGYNSTLLREQQVTIAADTWTRGSQADADAISARVDVLALRGAGKSGGWTKISHSQQWDEAQRAWHNTTRYTGTEKVTDTA